MLITVVGSIVQCVLVLVTTTHWYYTSWLAVFRLRANGPNAKSTLCEFISNMALHLNQWIPSWIRFSLSLGSPARYNTPAFPREMTDEACKAEQP